MTNNLRRRVGSESVAFGSCAKMPDRYFGSRVKRLFNEKGWSMAEFSRRTGVGRSVLKRIMETRGYCQITRDNIERLAVVFNVTREYLERGTFVEGVVTPSATASAIEISRLRGEVDALRRRRSTPQMSAFDRAAIDTIKWASEEKLEVIFRDDKFVVMREHEYEIAAGDSFIEALAIARNGDNDE